MSNSKSSTTIAILDENLHSIACKSCRHLHLYCDKRLPTCSECAQRGRTCCYEKPKKRGRPVRNCKSSSSSSEQSHSSDGSSTTHSSGDSSNSSNDSANADCSNVEKNSRKIFKFQLSDEKNTEMKRYHPYNVLDIVNKCKYSKGRNLSVVGIDDELIRNNCKLETIDFFYKVVDPGFDLIPITEMKHLLIEMNESSRENVGFISMMYSIQALCEQRLANPQRSEMAASECRKYLTRSDYNIYTKISYAVLSDYFGGEGQDDVAMSYLNHLNRILGDVPKSFEYLIVRADRNCKVFDQECLGVISSIVFIYSLYRPSDNSHSFDLKSIEEGINSQNAEVAISFVQQVKNIMEAIFIKSSKKYSEDYAAMKHILHEFVFISGISSIFFSLGLEGEIVDSLVDRADKLMEDFNVQLSSVSVFPHLSVFMSYRVKKFGNILAEFQFQIMNGMDIRSIFCLEKFQKYFNGIVLYLKTMNEFSKRYKRISKYFCQLYQNLLAIAKWKFDVQAQIIPNAILEEDRVEQDSERELPSLKSPIADIPIPLLTPMLSSGKESTFLSCLEKAKLNQAFSI